jgi:diacylglycerol kinase (ATP)
MGEQNNKPGATGLTRIINATGYSAKGLRAAFVNEAAFRQELLLCAVMVPLALWLGQTGVERALLISSVLLVLIVELINSAIEAVVDRFGNEMHELSGRAKDIGSAAVMISLIMVFVVWALVLYDRFY